MKVALCQILRNESFLLDFQLGALAPRFPMVIANDYGSTDGTQAILQKHGVNWQQTEWPNSYGEARNQVMDRAWALGAEAVFFLDGDEMIWPEQTGRILACERNAIFPRVNLRLRRYFEDFSFPDYQARFITKASGARFTGNVHEVIAGSSGWWKADVTLYHYNHFKSPQFMHLKNINYDRMLKGEPNDWTIPVPADSQIPLAGAPYVHPLPFECLYSHDWFSPRIPGLTQFLGPEFAHKPFNLLEIGCYEGRSTRWFLENFPDVKMQCVDTFGGGEDHKKLGIRFDGVKERFWFNVDQWRDRVSLFHGSSFEFFWRNADMFDAIYVDGEHTAAAVLADVLYSLMRLKKGGIMVVDDYAWDANVDPAKNPRMAVDAVLGCFAHELEVLDKNYHVILRKL